MPKKNSVRARNRFAGGLIHIFTACGAYVGMLALYAIYHHKILLSFWLMFIAVLIDAVDGVFARYVKIKDAVPEINGELLDNIVDFFNYTLVPVFFLLVVPIVPEKFQFACAAAIIFSSAYQFTQVDAKTSDHFFKGFPSYWNIVIFYLFFWQMHTTVNLIILLAFAFLSFVPIKYVYPSRLDHLTHHAGLQFAMLIATVIWGFATAGLLWAYPASNYALDVISMAYLGLYFVISLYRTWVPLR